MLTRRERKKFFKEGLEPWMTVEMSRHKGAEILEIIEILDSVRKARMELRISTEDFRERKPKKRVLQPL